MTTVRQVEAVRRAREQRLDAVRARFATQRSVEDTATHDQDTQKKARAMQALVLVAEYGHRTGTL